MPKSIFESEDQITVERMQTLTLDESAQLATVGIFVELRKIRELLEREEGQPGRSEAVREAFRKGELKLPPAKSMKDIRRTR